MLLHMTLMQLRAEEEAKQQAELEAKEAEKKPTPKKVNKKK